MYTCMLNSYSKDQSFTLNLKCIKICYNSDPNTDSPLFVQSPLVRVTDFYSRNRLAYLHEGQIHTFCQKHFVVYWWLFYTKSTTQWPGYPSFPLNECIYNSALLCIAVHPKLLWGGGGLSSTTTSVQHPLGWCDGCHRTTAPVRSPHISYRWRGEREIEPIKWMGIIRRPWLIRASGGNLASTPGYTPTLYEKCHGIFNFYRESGPRFNVSSERRSFLTV